MAVAVAVAVTFTVAVTTNSWHCWYVVAVATCNCQFVPAVARSMERGGNAAALIMCALAKIWGTLLPQKGAGPRSCPEMWALSRRQNGNVIPCDCSWGRNEECILIEAHSRRNATHWHTIC